MYEERGLLLKDVQTERVLELRDVDELSIGSEGDVELPVGSPWSNRGGTDNVQKLLDGVKEEHITLHGRDSMYVMEPHDKVSTVYRFPREVTDAYELRNGETIVLGDEKSELWEGYRLRVFF
ncbi:MAG: hypothetical protein ABEJ72_04410 [Candidatus Aenigmatarchaeota archaeon]